MTADGFFDLPRWFAESQTILWSRLLLGDEVTENLSREYMTPTEQWEMAQRHPNQAKGMLQSKAERNS